MALHSKSHILLITILCLVFYSCETSPKFSYEEFDYSHLPFYELPMGEHPVGFRFEMFWDNSRSFNGIDQRPILAGIWYPADVDTESQLTFGDYAVADTQHDGVLINDTTEAYALDFFSEYAKVFSGATKESFHQLFNTPVRAFDQPAIKEGKHPLVLYAASFNANVHENSPLFEQMASKGYIVAAIASVGHDAPGMTADTTGVYAQLDDFYYLHRQLTNRDYVDDSKVATMGFSWGGFPATLLGIEKEVQAIITLDGSHAYFLPIINHFKNIYTKPVPSVYVQLNQREMVNKIVPDTSLFHHAQSTTDSFLFRFKKMDHIDFSGFFLYMNGIGNDSIFTQNQITRYGSPYSFEVKSEGYTKISEITLLTLDAYLRNDQRAKERLSEQAPEPFLWKRASLKAN